MENLEEMISWKQVIAQDNDKEREKCEISIACKGIKLSTEELMLLNCDVGEDSWESLDCKEIKQVNPKENQSWIFMGRTAAEAEAPILWPPDVKNWLSGKDPDAGKIEGREKGKTVDEIVRWHHQLDGYKSEQAPEVGDEQGILVCCSPRSCRVGHNLVSE